MKVAIIDDGITRKAAKRFSNIQVVFLRVNKNFHIEKEKIAKYFRISSHAEICFELYAQGIVEQKTKLYSINIMDAKEEKGDIQKFLTALRWCKENDIDLINLSVGTTNYWDFTLISDILKELNEKNILIVAAHANNCKLSYPASSEYVIGGRCDKSCVLPAGTYSVLEEGIFNSEIIYSEYFSNFLKNIDQPVDGFNSYATPLITAEVHKALVNGCKNISEVMCYLKNNCNSAFPGDRKSHALQIKENITIPIVVLESNTYEGIKLLNYLVYMMKEDHYITFSIIDSDIVYGKQSVSLKKLLTNCKNSIFTSLCFMEDYTGADILFLQTKRKDLASLYDEGIIDITLTNKNCEEKKKNMIFFKDGSKEEAEMIKNRIVKLLSATKTEIMGISTKEEI